MKTFSTIACGLIAATIVAAPASAATVVFDTWNTSTDGTDGIVRAFAASGINVKATAFSYNSSLSRAFLGDYGSAGLGVTNNNESGANETHRVDNSSGNDFIMLVFDRAVNVSGAVLNTYSGGDTDAFVSYATLNGAYGMDLSTISLSNSVFSTLNSNGKNVEGAASGTLTNLMTGVSSGNVWVIGAARNGAAGYWDKYTDSFKVGTVNVTASIPEPATWAMMIGGFGLVGMSMRRRRRAAVTFTAA
ncbi:MAG: PEPxxWA-CTERM sorting domain-containing protein [Pseudomonadota bacterium]